MGGCVRVRWFLVAAALLQCRSLVRPWQIEAKCKARVQDRCYDSSSSYFYIDNHEFKKKYIFGVSYEAECIPEVPLSDEAWPAFPELVTFDTIILSGCAPPHGSSFAREMRKRNIDINRSTTVKLLDIPITAFIERNTLSGMAALRTLWMTTSSGVLKLQKGALMDVVPELRTLNLTRVRADEVPLYIENFTLIDTGITELQPLGVYVYHLEIQEPKVTYIRGKAPQLHYMLMKSPITSLPLAEELWTLDIDGRYISELPEGFVQQLWQLQYMHLHDVQKLPNGFLRGADHLVNFTYVDSYTTVLPVDLFSYTWRLKYVDLRRNHLEALPVGFFSKTPSLEVLHLNNNRLTAQGLQGVASATSLKHLYAGHNSLGDLCAPGGPSLLFLLENLETLALAEVQLKHMCLDWLQDMRRLTSLELRENGVESLRCAELRVQRAAGLLAEVDLSRNPVNRIKCTEEDYFKDYLPTEQIARVATQRLFCDCDGYWLTELHKKLDSTETTHRPNFGTSSCLSQWEKCPAVKVMDLPCVETEIIPYESNPNVLKIFCKRGQSLSSQSKRGTSPSRYLHVEVYDCPVPSTSYVTALRRINVLVVSSLKLFGLPAGSNLTASSFECLPPTVDTLWLRAEEGLMVPAPGVIAQLKGIVELDLKNVKPDVLPPHVSRLTIDGSGYEELTREDLLPLVKLKVTDNLMSSLNGYMPKLWRLEVQAPIATMPHAPALSYLWLHSATAAAMPMNFRETLKGPLENLYLKSIRGKDLPFGFLMGAKKLELLEITDSKLVTLPSELFWYSLNLYFVDLSRNKLKTLPMYLFSKSKRLQVLLLADNQLTMPELFAVMPLVSARELVLSNNPLGDLCYPGGPSVLMGMWQLKLLDLSNTNATRLCSDWLYEMEHLARFNFAHNRVTSVSCADLRLKRKKLSGLQPNIDLSGNPVERVYCTRADYAFSTRPTEPVYKDPYDTDVVEFIYVIIDSTVKCDCGLYWVDKIAYEMRGRLRARRGPGCGTAWRYCE